MFRSRVRASLGLLLIASISALSGDAGAAGGLGGRISSVAGTGRAAVSGDRGPAAGAPIDQPRGLAPLPDGGFVFADISGSVVRKVAANGTITLLAGTRRNAFSGDGGPATRAALNLPHAVAALADGGILIADTGNSRIRRIAPDGTISTVAGQDRPGYGGDGGPATSARLNTPRGVSVTSDGGFLIADTENQRIRRVSKDGVITTVAGSGIRGFLGDNGPALAARLTSPFAVAALPDGGFLITDTQNERIRRVSPAGIITTVVGNGVARFSGDGGPAVGASLNYPHNVFPLGDGGFLVADTGNDRIRLVDANGVITTVAGNGKGGFRGDGGRATAAALNAPRAVAATPRGGILISDAENHRIRFVGSDSQPYLVRLRFSLSARGARAQRPVVVSTTLSTWAAVQITIRFENRTLGRADALRRPGTNLLTIPGMRLGRGAYLLIGRARSFDGQSARVTKTLKIFR